jgi:DNA-binding NarL/FixJ family response regulator
MSQRRNIVKMQSGAQSLEPVAAPNAEAKSHRKIGVAIVEDDAKLLSTLVTLINLDQDFEVKGCFGNTPAALEGIPPLNPDVVIMDINLPGIDGVECVSQLKKICPRPQVLMLTVYEDTDAVFSALRAGASGYLLKQTPIEELLNSLREINRGGSPMSSHIARKVVDYFQAEVTAEKKPETLAELSGREREVLELFAEGFLFKEISDRLGVSFGTVHTYSRRIYEKLHVYSRAQAVAKFFGDKK